MPRRQHQFRRPSARLTTWGWPVVMLTIFLLSVGSRRVAADTSLFTCQDIAEPGTYVLSAGGHFESTGDCFTVTNQSNITIDGNGQTVNAGGNAITITGRSIGITVQNATLNSTIAVTGPPDVPCGNSSIPEQITLAGLHLTAGDIEVNGACSVTITGNTLDAGGISISNAYVVNSIYNVQSNRLAGGLWLYNTKDLVVEDNIINDRVSVMGGFDYTTNATFRHNSIISTTGYLDTLDIFRIRGVRNSVFDANDVESLVPNSAVVVKVYDTRNTAFTNNTFLAAASGPAYGALELRSSTQDNTFYRNQFLAPQAGGVGFMSHFSNVGCDTEGYFPPTDLVDCRDQGYDPTKYCGDPQHPNYKAPYNNRCDDRRNTFDSNIIIGGRIGVWHYGDGRGNIFRNNVIVGATGVEAGECEGGNNGSAAYYGNTISASDVALRQSVNCPIVSRNSIFHSSGSVSISTTNDGFRGDYNLFWPAAATAQAHALNVDPRFVNAAAADPLQRNFQLQSNSPAIDVGDPDSMNAPLSLTKDIVGADRPTGSGYDIGAYEYGAVALSCYELWQCAPWSDCTGGTQTRSCTDDHQCGTTENRPVLARACDTSCYEQWSCTDWSSCTGGQQTRNCTDDHQCGTTVRRPPLVRTCSGSPACGPQCGGCTSNRILGPACSTPRRQCDGTNSVEDIRLSAGTISIGSPITVDIDYSCYDGTDDNVALWYYNGSSWRLIQYWGRNTLTGCNHNPGMDGTVSATFAPDGTVGTHLVRAIEAAGTMPDDQLANASSCPNLGWGNIDDLTFRVTPAGSCSEHWVCEPWSGCVNGQQSQVCTDANRCGTTADQPPLTRSCGCLQDWHCDDWTACVDGTQTRSCIDLQNCQSTTGAPPMSRSCGAADSIPPSSVMDLRAH